MKAPISVCLIVKNEPLLENCILSIKDYVEEIVIVDTGSTDGTDLIAEKYADIFERYSGCNDPTTGLINDFSNARQRSFDLATKPWVMWVDADDEIFGAENLIEIVKKFEPDAVSKNISIMFPYEYSYNELGQSTCTHYRERLVSNKNSFHWLNPVHEVLVPNDGITPTFLIEENVIYKHNRQHSKRIPEPGRNLRILRAYFEKHGDSDARQLYYLGLECFNAGLIDEAYERLKKYIDISGWDDEQAMACMKIIDIFLGKGEYEQALPWAFKLISLKENWCEGYFALGKLFYFMAQAGGPNEMKNWEKSVHFIKMGFEFPPTKTLLFINPTERDVEIHKFYNMALFKIGKVVEALESANSALKHNPTEPSLLSNKKIYEELLLKRECDIALGKLSETNVISKEKYQSIINILNGDIKNSSIEWNIPLDLSLESLPLDISDKQLESCVIMLWKQFMLYNKVNEGINFLENAKSIINSNLISDALALSNKCLGSNIVLSEPSNDKLDIVFFAGDGVEEWNPVSVRKTGIGGSELMLMEQAKRLAALGHRVRVFNSCGVNGQGSYDNVEYLLTNKYQDLTCDVLIVSRRADMLSDQYNINAKLKLLWLHDVCAINAKHEWLLKADNVLVLSEWHKQNVINVHNLHPDHIIVTRNGIDLKRFDRNIIRNKFRVINSSSPDRSWPILLSCWAAIKSQVPQAELHLFYGFKNWEYSASNSPPQLDLIRSLKQKIKEMEMMGVYYHDRVSQDELAKEMLNSGVLAYPTWFTETSCISAMEAQAAGLRIVTSNIAALKETVGSRGVLIDGDWTSTDYKNKFIENVVNNLKKEDNSDRLLLQKYAKDNFGLDGLANSWNNMFYELIESKKTNPISPYQPTVPYRKGGNGYYAGDTRKFRG